MTEQDRIFWLAVRQALRIVLSAIETRFGFERTVQKS